MAVATLAERFAAKYVVAEDGCWNWISTKSTGYGQIRVKGRYRYAHRVSHELHKGPIPDGLQIDHLCRNRACVNPDHLEPVTARENVRRSPIAPPALNARKTHCPRGHSLTVPNLYFDKRGGRMCKRCVLDRSRERYIAMKANR